MTPDRLHFRRIAWLLTAAAGWMNIISALYPAIQSRLDLLRELLSLHVIRGTQTATLLVGFALILLADGLRQRRRRALQVAVVLLLSSCVLNLAKGLDFEEAILGAALAAALIAHRGLFTVPSPPPSLPSMARQVWTFVLVMYCYLFAGFLLLRAYIIPAPSLPSAAFEPFRLLLGLDSYRYLGPQAQWFERTEMLIAGVAIVLGLIDLLRPLVPLRRTTAADLAQARDLVRQHGSDTLSYFALQDGRQLFFDSTGEAFLSYRLWSNVAVVGGEPIGPPGRVVELVDRFLEFASANGIAPCFLGVSAEHVGLYRSRGLHTLKIGEEALVDLRSFEQSVLKRKVRRAARHIEQEGISLQMHRRAELPPDVLAQIDALWAEWLSWNGGEPRGFSMTLGRLPRASDADCELVVATRGQDVLGYLSLVPVYQGSGWSLDAMRRSPAGPNGLMEALILHAVNQYRERGYAWLSLNFATLANDQNDIDSRAVERTTRLLFHYLSGFYQLKSLQQFNGKFRPQWRSRYLAYGDVLAFPKVALAVVQSEDPLRLPFVSSVFRR